ncbi:MAG: hypothetical protein OXG05_09705 [Gammaproteobacteria bacterium]|nr:hypothetical protein [Gammaproteobacteria bacterium]
MEIEKFLEELRSRGCTVEKDRFFKVEGQFGVFSQYLVIKDGKYVIFLYLSENEDLTEAMEANIRRRLKL